MSYYDSPAESDVINGPSKFHLSPWPGSWKVNSPAELGPGHTTAQEVWDSGHVSIPGKRL